MVLPKPKTQTTQKRQRPQDNAYKPTPRESNHPHPPAASGGSAGGCNQKSASGPTGFRVSQAACEVGGKWVGGKCVGGKWVGGKCVGGPLGGHSWTLEAKSSGHRRPFASCRLGMVNGSRLVKCQCLARDQEPQGASVNDERISAAPKRLPARSRWFDECGLEIGGSSAWASPCWPCSSRLFFSETSSVAPPLSQTFPPLAQSPCQRCLLRRSMLFL